MKILDNPTSAFLQRVFDLLLVNDPQATSMGVWFGLVAHGAVIFFMPILASRTPFDWASLELWHFVGVGVVLLNLPNLFRPKRFEPTLENALKLITDQLAAGNLTMSEAQGLYRQLVRKVVDSVKLDDEVTRRLRELESLPKSGDSDLAA